MDPKEITHVEVAPVVHQVGQEIERVDINQNGTVIEFFFKDRTKDLIELIDTPRMPLDWDHTTFAIVALAIWLRDQHYKMKAMREELDELKRKIG